MKVVKVSLNNLDKIILKAKKSLKKGEILICPTDTVYGLICDARNEKAVKMLLKLKKRQAKKPIPIFVKDIKMAKELAFFNKKQEKFLRKVWPGKITVVLKRKGKLPKILFGGRKTIGLRIPKYKIVNLLLEKFGYPLTGTSANLSGKPASTKIKEVINQFKGQKFKPDLILDAGDLKRAKPSTVIDLTLKKPKIIRP